MFDQNEKNGSASGILPVAELVDKEAAKGHVLHSKAAESAGLAGAMPRPIKVTMLGAGSGFTPTITRDIFTIPHGAGGIIALVDVDRERLETMHQIVCAMAERVGITEGVQWSVQASTDREDVLRGSDYVINCIEVSGLECVAYDNDIPARYGVDQCIGDTVGPGGLFKAMRTVPVFLDILRDVERLAPQALVLNYTNPMSIMCLAAGRAVPSVRVVGLCHSIQETTHVLARRAGVPEGLPIWGDHPGFPFHEFEWECAGINHLAWFTRLAHRGEDLYPRLKAMARRDLAGDQAHPDDGVDLIRKDMMLHFGAFITESSGHLSEYLPYYRTRPDRLKQYGGVSYNGGSRFYADHWPDWRHEADEHRMRLVRGEADIEWVRSWEYGSWIIEAREKNSPMRIHGNVMNGGSAGSGQLIANLPADGCVEVACLVDSNGVNPIRYGALPRQMAAICDSNMRMIDLAAQAVIERSKEAAIFALMLDPLTSAVCSPAEIQAMTLEMFDAEAAFLPGFK